MNWDEDLQLSLKAESIQDDIYRSIWPVKEVVRFKHEDDKVLDIRYHIDVEVRMDNGICLLGQEKALRYRFSHYNTFTIEFYQNANTKEGGEFFNLGAQFYLHGYWNEGESGLCKWYIIKIFDFLEFLKSNDIKTLEAYTKTTGGSRASFFCVDYKKIPSKFIYAKYEPHTQRL